MRNIRKGEGKRFLLKSSTIAAGADPEFPFKGGEGWQSSLGWGSNLQCGCFLAKMYVKTKEFGLTVAGGRKLLYVDPPLIWIPLALFGLSL